MSEDLMAVLVVDDAAPFREAAAEVVEALPGFRLVGTAASGEQALQAVRNGRVDLILMDVIMPGMNGLEAAERVHAEFPDTRVLLLSGRAREELPRLETVLAWCDFCPKADFGPEVLRALWRAPERG